MNKKDEFMETLGEIYFKFINMKDDVPRYLPCILAYAELSTAFKKLINSLKEHEERKRK